MRALVLTNSNPNQVALVNRLSDVCEIAAIVVSRNRPRRKPGFGARLRAGWLRVAEATQGKDLRGAWKSMQDRYSTQFPSFPATRMLHVSNVNDSEVLSEIDRLNPDLLIVSGTNLLGKKLIAHAQKKTRILNLHTGISPYVKGGPNCTNWCLAKGWFHLIGNTIMWLDAGIDTGHIVATEQTPLTGTESLNELHVAVMDHAHDLYRRAVQALEAGDVKSTPQQELGDGTTFFSHDWNARQMKQALFNFRHHYSKEAVNARASRLASEMKRLVPLVFER